MTVSSMREKASGRIVWVDYARALAILAVVLCHATESAYRMNLEGVGQAAWFSQAAAFTLFTIGRIGVPLFLFMSGYLMLDRSYGLKDCSRFWRSKWCGLLLATEVWVVLYYFFLNITQGRPFSLSLLICNMLFLEPVGMGHMWYMPMIIGLYLFLPFIANGLKALEDWRSLRFPLTIMLALLFVIPVLSVVKQALGGDSESTLIDAGFSGGVYGCYMLLGYCIKKGAFKSVPNWLVVTLGLLAFAFAVVLQLFSYSEGVRYNVWYNNGLLMLAGLALFELLSRATNLRASRVVSTLSYYSFALYLVHFPVRLLLAPIVLGCPLVAFLPRCCGVVILFAAVLALSLPLCVLIARIPKIGAKILYLKS